jgi:hypothetical protein
MSNDTSDEKKRNEQRVRDFYGPLLKGGERTPIEKVFDAWWKKEFGWSHYSLSPADPNEKDTEIYLKVFEAGFRAAQTDRDFSPDKKGSTK